MIADRNSGSKCSSNNKKPGSFQESYHHVPGYTGHIPTMRYQTGGSFGRTSRHILEDSSMAQGPNKPRFHNQFPQPLAGGLKQCADPQQRYNNNNNERKFPRNCPVVNTQKQSDKLCDRTSSKTRTRTSPISSPTITTQKVNNKKDCLNYSFNDNTAVAGSNVEVYQLPYWPKEGETFNPGFENENDSFAKCHQQKNRPGTAIEPMELQKLNLDHKLAKLVQQAFTPSSDLETNANKPEQLRGAGSELPSRKCSQMSLQQQHQPMESMHYCYTPMTRINESVIPPRPQTCHYIPEFGAGNYDNNAFNNGNNNDQLLATNNLEIPRSTTIINSSAGDSPSEKLVGVGQLLQKSVVGEDGRSNQATLTEIYAAPDKKYPNRSPYRIKNPSSVDTQIYRSGEGLAPAYGGHVPGYAFHSGGRSYGQVTCGTKEFLEKCVLHNRNNMHA